MKLYIQQHIFTIGARFSVYDEEENEIYHIESEVLTLGRKLHVYDRNNCEAAYIEQKLFTFMPQYAVYINGNHAFDIVKNFTLFFSSYDINGMGLCVDGDFMGHNYSISRNGAPCASIYKEWFTIGDCYCLDIQNESDALAVLCAAIVIDCIAASRN